MTRGEIWWVDFGVPQGNEVGFQRPVIILQNNVLNASKLKTVIVLPLTTNMMYADIPNNIVLEKKITGLAKTSVTQPHLIVHVDKNRLYKRVTRLDTDILEKVVNGVVESMS